mmetsp:Transcript_15916/g.23980  ORF Transcript_15916/g.23980 Transcript_15916/m.23980 type:complete len:176 (+) Transcript_15916:118-645(+)|eukprot:CAMPEP_0185032072 /NCGR_PEP_ID=MMETSP1103-20130426/19929_1 /TAXON_ID=36769 /ORGANISM="Paraphysomonas bandaiensis, Strain Caron Lab Isolate" /LENGTH=175 /DNA_ID=CAMNT_0027567831 /DNA_START=63 /DNA_END=590 /DNA_ORIENTATION=-
MATARLSKFTEKAIDHVSSQTAVSILDGREGQALKIVATRLQMALKLTNEQLDDYYDAFVMFPLDDNHRISVSSLQKFYTEADIDLSEEDCLRAIGSLSGINGLVSLDFEAFVLSMERWIKKDVHHEDVLKMAYTVFGDEDGVTLESMSTFMNCINGPPLTRKEVRALVDHANST